MILYNIRHRGPYEYDKFVLDIFQICSETKRLLDGFQVSSGSDIIKKTTALDAYIDSMSKENGLLQEILITKLAIDE